MAFYGSSLCRRFGSANVIRKPTFVSTLNQDVASVDKGKSFGQALSGGRITTYNALDKIINNNSTSAG